LRSLQYRGWKTFNPNDEKQWTELILWLEENINRFYEGKEWDDFEKSAALGGKPWEGKWKQYLLDINCPIADRSDNFEVKLSILESLTSIAVANAFSRNRADINEHAQAHLDHDMVVQKILETEFGEKEMLELLVSMCKTLGLRVNGNESAADLLETIAFDVSLRFASQSPQENGDDGSGAGEEKSDGDGSQGVEKRKKGRQGGLDQSVSSIMKSLSLGFTTGDKEVDRAASVLRFLHILTLRQLQSVINHMISSAQVYTANPQMDARLGKVGR
tara:strand:- start:190 stop:1011 length:822 start_codon:yes stop_codon:yes gene_type:complete